MRKASAKTPESQSDGLQVPQQLRRRVWRGSVAAADRSDVYPEYLSRRVQPLYCGERGVLVSPAAAVIEPALLVKLGQQIKTPDNARLRNIRKAGALFIICAGRSVRLP